MDPAKFFAEVMQLTQDSEKANIFEKYASLKTINDVESFVKGYSEDAITKSVGPLMKLFKQLENLGLKNYVIYDPSVVRGLDYYTGMVFEIFDKHPENNRAVAGGGAYANLLQIFNEPALGGVGIGLGEVPLTNFLEAHKLLPDFSKTEIDVLIAYTVTDGEKEAQLLAEQLRSRGIKSEVLFGEAKMKKVFTYSEKKNFKFIAVFGEDEMKKREVQLKNLTSKDTQNVELQDVEKISRILKGI
jgi:histidyl-tRNA synthetase